MLLLITASEDGTSDLICRELGDKVFRFNFDIFADYFLEFTPEYWRITNPVGHTIDSNTVSSCFWWKAFNFPIKNQDKFIVDEVKYIFRELFSWCKLRGMVKGNPFDFHNQLGKINILTIAAEYFEVPKTLITFKCSGIEKFEKDDLVAKSLTTSLTDNMGTLLTTEVNRLQLHPDFPWFLQEKIVSDFDVTVFVCGENLFPYERSRANLKGLDWRSEQNFDPKVREWLNFELSNADRQNIKSFCKKLNVDWGRLDLMRVNNKLIFLEFNANGQWVFLDYSGEDRLVQAVSKYLME